MHTHIQKQPIYLDANATVAQLPEVMKAVSDASMLGPVNASSAHSFGDLGRAIVNETREALRDLLEADEENIIFVSSGTEANNIVVNGFARIPEAILLCSATEHASVLEPALAHGGHVLEVGSDGIVDIPTLDRAIRAAGIKPALVSIQAANSETGVIQPLDQISELCGRGSNVFLHVDAAQAFGRIPLDVTRIDALSVSGHELHGPLGSGFLCLSDRLADILPRTVLGGGQERGFAISLRIPELSSNGP